jgi:hypothetical protein
MEGGGQHEQLFVCGAKYHYEFWRPVTAIRNADLNDNPATERDATWQPLDNTPMHITGLISMISRRKWRTRASGQGFTTASRPVWVRRSGDTSPSM